MPVMSELEVSSFVSEDRLPLRVGKKCNRSRHDHVTVAAGHGERYRFVSWSDSDFGAGAGVMRACVRRPTWQRCTASRSYRASQRPDEAARADAATYPARCPCPWATWRQVCNSDARHIETVVPPQQQWTRS